MCGIAAVASFAPRSWTDATKAMSDALAHRGPDDSVVAALPAESVALCRLLLSALFVLAVITSGRRRGLKFVVPWFSEYCS
jgi:asparagine synthetase B (glutamine-hydrolysing)